MSDWEFPTPPKKEHKLAVSIVLAVIALVGLSTIGWLFAELHGPRAAFQQFGNALVAGDYQRAYSLTSFEFKQTMSLSAFAAQQGMLCSELGALKKVREGLSSTKGTRSGWASTIWARFEYERAERIFTFVLKKEDGRWVVMSYRQTGQ